MAQKGLSSIGLSELSLRPSLARGRLTEYCPTYRDGVGQHQSLSIFSHKHEAQEIQDHFGDEVGNGCNLWASPLEGRSTNYIASMACRDDRVMVQLAWLHAS